MGYPVAGGISSLSPLTPFISLRREYYQCFIGTSCRRDRRGASKVMDKDGETGPGLVKLMWIKVILHLFTVFVNKIDV